MLEINTLQEEYVERLHSIFDAKGWFDFDQDVKKIFERFCSRLLRLKDDEQRELILELTEKYLWVTSDKYEEYLKQSLQELFVDEGTLLENGGSKNILICPLVPDDNEKIKSGHYVSYLCQSVLIQTLDTFRTCKARISTIGEIQSENNNKISLIILVDDYVGSGQTGLECLAKLKDKGIIPKEKKLVILCLVAQEEGIKLLDEANVKVYCWKKQKKGITESFGEKEAERKKRIMKEISHIMGAKNGYELGFEQTEGLVTMIKTPNNTFPFFWFEDKRNKDAPFSRRKMYFAPPKVREDCQNDPEK